MVSPAVRWLLTIEILCRDMHGNVNGNLLNTTKDTMRTNFSI